MRQKTTNIFQIVFHQPYQHFELIQNFLLFPFHIILQPNTIADFSRRCAIHKTSYIKIIHNKKFTKNPFINIFIHLTDK